jgi:hypothetical protein
VQVVNLHLFLGKGLLMAQETMCASLPVLLVACRVLRGLRREGPEAPLIYNT